MLNCINFGDDTTRPPLLIVHGLFGSARNWGAIARRMAEDRRVVTVDMRNHGESFWSADHSYPALADDLAQVISAFGGLMDVMGHSMGGKAAMYLALSNPGIVNRLVVADIAPVAYDHSMVHLTQAMRAMDLAGLTSRAEADRRLAPAVPDEGTRAFLLQSLDLKSTAPRWRLNLDALETAMPLITGWPGAEGSYTGLALFLAGAESNYVKPEHRTEIKRLFPTANLARIPGAGHWLHADKPREFEAALRTFLS